MEKLHPGEACSMSNFKGRVGLAQRVLPRYRASFFDMLAERCTGGFSVIAGQPRPGEAIGTTTELREAKYSPARNIHLLSGPLYFCWQRGLLAWLRTWDPQVLIVEANPRYLSTPHAVNWMKQRNRPVIGWGLGAPRLRDSLAGLRQARRQRFLSQFDALIAYSQRGENEYRRLGFPADRIFVAPNAVAPRPQAEAPKRNVKFVTPATVLFVGRLQARKGIDSLLRAAAGLPKELQPGLQIVGEGPARLELEDLAAEVYPAAEFTGALYGPALEVLFAAADLFVLPGTGGLAIQQALAYGLPIIVAEGDGSQEDMVSSVNGWLLPIGDEAALRAALAEALSDGERLRQMGAASFRLAQERFNLEAMVQGFVTALNEVTK